MKTKDQRTHHRHPLKDKAIVDFIYDFHAQVDIRSARTQGKPETLKCHGVCKNISAEGLCFVSEKKLKRGERLDLEFYVSDRNPPIRMQGNVQWSKKASGSRPARFRFDTGLRLITIEGKAVRDSIHFDETYELYWSDVLELISGRWKQFIKDFRERA
jgi:hypothetical protein